ncbi:MAG: UDP-glucose 4-epimerase [Candidatus Kaiserbacteria bacterium GW2011_GWA2_58_9]|uniref:UDP-glucose 4-epimerase n=1 Tax=Candidatus Kaiserbacteria bacterium GW2011_GWA2_58_9 TaxID=1618672 RepID=A0A0G2B1X0_9BACT|nr:MAG: UDP-glucose 4-epimerase [Candidatus Kaiserbacteria bacterium GW2011_GWA2_58_9]
MTYLVTGGAGFIGSHISAALLKAGHAVRIFDDFSSGKRENIPAGADVITGDVCSLDALRLACVGVDGVFHLAALPRVQLSIDKPLETNEVNITGTLNVLLAARDAKVRRVVYTASSSAYGDQPTLPLHEDMKVNPKSPYGLQKYVGEEYAKVASLCWGLETVSLRYFNVYGPRLTFAGAYVTVIAVFLKQKAAGQPLTITGDGTQTRDFTYVDDVVAANLLAMESPKVGKGEVVNIGAGNNVSVNTIAGLIEGPSVHIEPRLEPHDTRADNRKARELLGWEPRIRIDEGIAELKKEMGVE